MAAQEAEYRPDLENARCASTNKRVVGPSQSGLDSVEIGTAVRRRPIPYARSVGLRVPLHRIDQRDVMMSYSYGLGFDLAQSDPHDFDEGAHLCTHAALLLRQWLNCFRTL